jgi:hypothetical protein
LSSTFQLPTTKAADQEPNLKLPNDSDVRPLMNSEIVLALKLSGWFVLWYKWR